jgi:hypothetical protein
VVCADLLALGPALPDLSHHRVHISVVHLDLGLIVSNAGTGNVIDTPGMLRCAAWEQEVEKSVSSYRGIRGGAKAFSST